MYSDKKYVSEASYITALYQKFVNEGYLVRVFEKIYDKMTADLIITKNGLIYLVEVRKFIDNNTFDKILNIFSYSLVNNNYDGFFIATLNYPSESLISKLKERGIGLIVEDEIHFYPSFLRETNEIRKKDFILTKLYKPKRKSPVNDAIYFFNKGIITQRDIETSMGNVLIKNIPYQIGVFLILASIFSASLGRIINKDFAYSLFVISCVLIYYFYLQSWYHKNNLT